MKDPAYWKKHYVLEADADEIERSLLCVSFRSGDKDFELVHFEKGKAAPNVLISPGSGGHSYVFAELGYLLRSEGYNVFIMPGHGGSTISQLMERHAGALEFISNEFSDRIGVFAEGLGGFVVFYLALADGTMRTMVLQNAPGLLTERKFQEAYLGAGAAAWRRRLLLPVANVLVRLLPGLKLPISLYLDWRELIDPKDGNRQIETRLVEGYLGDPDFDKWYPLSAIMSLVSTPPPRPLSELRIPTMLLVPSRGWTDPRYLRDLFGRLPEIKKKLIEVDGSVYWMLSHPKEAASVIAGWFDETL